MAGKGGYQRPKHPAAVSGPGKLSRRTDGGPSQPIRHVTGLPYGQSQALDQTQAAAPMSMTAADVPSTPPASPSPPNIIGLDAPSARPDEPVTAGAPAGAGPGPEALSFNQTAPANTYGSLQEILSQYAASDPTGSMSSLLQEAQRRGIM
jgi:hypothetical protein